MIQMWQQLLNKWYSRIAPNTFDELIIHTTNLLTIHTHSPPKKFIIPLFILLMADQVTFTTSTISFLLSLKLAWVQIKKFPCISLMSVFSIALVIGVTGMFQTIIQLSPQIMIKLSQSNIGTVDYRISINNNFVSSQYNGNYPYLNLSKFENTSAFPRRFERAYLESNTSNSNSTFIFTLIKTKFNDELKSITQKNDLLQIQEGQCLIDTKIQQESFISTGQFIQFNNKTNNFRCKVKQVIQSAWPLFSRDFQSFIIINTEDIENVQQVVFFNDSIYGKDYKSSLLNAKQIQATYNQPVLNLQFPIVSQYRSFQFFNLFLLITFDLIIMLLVAVSIIMLYNVLIASVQTRVFQACIMRTVGGGILNLGKGVIVQAFIYIVIGMVFGFGLAIGGLSGINLLLKTRFNLQIAIFPSTTAIILILGLSVLIPIISSIIPIYNASNQQLADGLNPFKTRITSILVQINKSTSFPYIQIAFGATCLLLGLLVYYILPITILTQDFVFLFFIFTFLLLGLLSSLTLFTFNFLYYIENVLIFPFNLLSTCYVKMCSKNLQAHRIKNRRTELMYALSVAIAVYLWVSLEVQISLLTSLLKQTYGTYYLIQSPRGISRSALDSVIKDQQFSKLVDSYTFVTLDLDDYLNRYKATNNFWVGNLGRNVRKSDLNIKGLEPNFFQTVFDFIDIEKGPSTTLSPTQYLYTRQGFYDAMLPADMQSEFQIDFENDPHFLVSFGNSSYSNIKKMKVGFLMNRAAGLKMGNVGVGKDIVVSLNTYMKLADITYDQVLYYSQTHLIRLRIKLVSLDKADQLQSLIKKKLTFYSYRTRNVNQSITQINLISQMEQINSLMTLIFSVLIVLILLLCFFNLVTSVSGNIFDHTKQIAIMRGIGVPKWKLVGLFILEAYVVVVTGSLIGVAVGTLVGYTMTIQQSIFVGIASQFAFPYLVKSHNQLIVIIMSSGIFLAALSTSSPLLVILNRHISDIFRTY